MASNINPNNIDGTFPIAGVDNDSQGFRSNFTNIKNNFTYAKTEITDLQGKAILKSALTGTTLDNNMSGSLLSSATVRDFREARYDFGSISGTVTLSHANGHYQTASTSGNITLAFSNLPAAGNLGRIIFEIEVTNTSHTLALPAAVTLGIKGIAGLSSGIITFSETGTYLFEFTTDDAGTNIHIADLTRARNYFYSDYIRLISRQITDARGQAGDAAGHFVVDTTTPAIWLCTGSYDGTTIIWRKAELETASNEVVLASNVTTTSSSLGTVTGLSFVAAPNVRYTFEAYIPFIHSTSSTSTHTFSVNFGAGSVCYATIEQQASPASAPSVVTIATSDSTASVVTTASTSARMCRIIGTFTTGAAPAAQRTLNIRFATSAGTLTALAGSYLRFNRV